MPAPFASPPFATARGRSKLSCFRILAFCLIGVQFSPFALAGGRLEEKNGQLLITVVAPNLPNMSDTATSTRAQAAVIDQFETDFPEIFRAKYLAKYQANPKKYGVHDWSKVSVRLEPYATLAVEGMENDMMAIAGDNPPDVLYVNFRKSDSYIRNGFLYPLDKPEDGYFSSLSKQEIAEWIHPKVWPVIDRKGPDGQEHIWALPTGGFAGRALAYRKDVFDEAGLPYPDASWTWDDLLAAAKKLTDPTRGRVGVLLNVHGDPGYEFCTFLWSAGGEAMVYDKTREEWRCTFGSREAAVALDFFNRLTMEPWKGADGATYRGYAFTDPAVGRVKWLRGEIGMMVMTIDWDFFADLNPDEVGLAPIPKGPAGVGAAALNSKMYGLYSQIKDPAVRDAAWEYIRYLDSDAAARVSTKVFVEGGMGRFVDPKFLNRFGYSEIVRLSPPGWGEVYEQVVAAGQPEPYGQNSALAYRMLSRPIDEVAQLSLQKALPEDREARLTLLEKILVQANNKANEVMMGRVSPGDRKIRNIVAAVFLLCMVAGFVFVLARVFDSFATHRPASSSGKGRLLNQRAIIGLMLAPAALSILFWKYYPLMVGSVMGFQNYKLLGHSNWVGLKNFGDVLWDDLWWHSVWNSVRFSTIALVCGFWPPTVLAILLQEVPMGKITFRLLFYLPSLLSGLVTMLLWKQLYDPSPNGALNVLVTRVPAIGFLLGAALSIWIGTVLARRLWFHSQQVIAVLAWLAGLVFAVAISSFAWPILSQHGMNAGALLATLPESIYWLRDPRYAMYSCIIPSVWAGMGPHCLIYLAALKGIPDDYYEAADLDGASFLDKIISIVLPTLKPLLVINFVGAFIGSWLGSADHILAMTGGQADTEVAPLSIFYKAFIYMEFGPATAMAWILGFMLIGFTVYQLRMLSRVEFRAAKGN